MNSHAKRPVRFRKKLLIYPKFQLILLIGNLAIMLGAFLAIGMQMARSYAMLRKMGADVHLSPTHPYFKFLDFQSQMVWSNILIALAVAFTLSAIVTLVLSHRLAGPIVRLKSYFRGISQGEPLRPLNFRKNDFFIDLPPLVNGAFEAVQKNREAAAPPVSVEDKKAA